MIRMRKRWIALLLILLSLSLVALLIRSTESSAEGLGGGGSGVGSGDTDGGDSGGAEVTSWVDPHTGINIFDYENFLKFTNGTFAFDWRTDFDSPWQSSGMRVKCTDAETVTIPEVDGMGQFVVELGTYTFESGYTYYCYYRQHPTGDWLPMIVNQYESSINNPYALALSVEVSDGANNHEHGFSFSYARELPLFIMNGMDGTMDYVVSGTFSVRIIKVPT